jgi:hypothetical protein
MSTFEQFRLLATLAEIAPELGLDPDALRKKADANYVEAHPYSFEIWRHLVEHTQRTQTIGDAIDSWITLSEGEDCATGDNGIFYHDREVVSKQQLNTWSCLRFYP